MCILTTGCCGKGCGGERGERLRMQGRKKCRWMIRTEMMLVEATGLSLTET